MAWPATLATVPRFALTKVIVILDFDGRLKEYKRVHDQARMSQDQKKIREGTKKKEEEEEED